MMTNSATVMTPETTANDILNDPAKLFQQLEDWRRQGFHVLTPATRVSRFAPYWGASVSFVHLDAVVDYESFGRGTDCYFDGAQMKRDQKDDTRSQRGIAKIGLDKLARACGISWDPTFSRRMDDRRIMNLWEFQAVGVGLDFDGMPFTINGHREVDLRDGSAQVGYWSPEAWREAVKKNEKAINGWSDRRVLNARSHGLSLCETKAKERAVRTLGLQHQYTVAQLAKPFVCIKATFRPDLTNADTLAQTTDHAMRGTRALFAQTSMARPIPVIDLTTREDVTPGRTGGTEPIAAAPSATAPGGDRSSQVENTTPAPSSGGAASAQQTVPAAAREDAPPVSDVPLTPKAVKVTATKMLKSGPNARGGWELWKVTFSNGQSFTTLNDRTIEDARAFEKLQDRPDGWCEYRTKETDDGKYTNLDAIFPAGQEPDLFGDNFDEAAESDGTKW